MKLWRKRRDKQTGEAVATAAPKKKRFKKWIIITAPILVIAIVLFALRGFVKKDSKTVTQYQYVTAEKRDVTSALSSSGTLEAADSYTLTTLVEGEVLSADFEEGDVVTKGDTLYKIDDSDTTNSLESAQLSLSQSQRSYDKKVASKADLTITSPISGVITGLTIKIGDTVNTQNAIATIEDVSKLTLTEYYSEDYAGQIYKGMTAVVSVPDQMMNLSGKVSEVSSLKRTSATGVTCFAVTVEVNNPGSLTSGTEATCWLQANGGAEIYPSISDSDGLDCIARSTIRAGVSGTVAQVKVSNSDTVTAGQTLVLLTSDTLDDDITSAANSLKNAQLSYENQEKKLDNYTISAPISGTIVEKDYKQGETVESGKTLCIIYDLSSLTLTMNVDELDISKVQTGQTATITAEAASGSKYEGTIIKVGINGTTSSGVTTYPVTIRVDKTDGLLPGMNVDVSITINQSKDSLAIPSAAVVRGNKVLVKSTDGSTGEGAPEGYKYATITTGVTDGTYVEIKSGLSQGDTVAYVSDTPTSTQTANSVIGFGVPGAGGGQGGVPGGGGQGGAPGGQYNRTATQSSSKATTSSSKASTSSSKASTSSSSKTSSQSGAGGNAP